MITTAHMPAGFLLLLDRFLDETISADEMQRLVETLDRDAAARAFFLRYCQLHINLNNEESVQRALTAFTHQQFPVGARARGARSSLSPLARRFRPPRRQWMVAAAAVVIALGATLFWKLRPDHTTVVIEPPPAQSPASNLAPAGQLAVHLAAGESRTLPIGERGRLVVAGPADFELLGATRAKLRRGRIRVRITSEKDRGFTVETPQANITDLGTEFGVDVAEDTVTGVVVFDGSVDLAVPVGGELVRPQTERLTQGEGLVVQRTGRLDRLMSIVAGDNETFGRPGEAARDGRIPLIRDVWDNLLVSDSRKLYEIVPGGFREDALCYVDRPAHEWNGWDAHGIPDYLLGADYVKTFNNNKTAGELKISVMLSRPARLFVFFDDRIPSPDWLRRDFHKTRQKIGVDEGSFVGVDQRYIERSTGTGPGQSVDKRFSIWEQVVPRAGVVELGSNGAQTSWTSMYGIAAVELDRSTSAPATR